MNVGTEWLVDAEGCAAELLRDIESVRGFCEEVIADLDLRVLGDPMWHQFPQPGGVTGLYLLSESHLACHTFPETGLATFNLYCCRPRPPFAWDERLRVLLGANRVTLRTAARGMGAATDRASLEARDYDLLDPSYHDSLEGSDHASIKASNHELLEGNGDASFEANFPELTSAREVDSP